MSLEKIYQKKTPLEHVLDRPDAYVGCIDVDNNNMWVWDDSTECIVQKNIQFSAGLYKIFDEILVNAADNKQRDRTMNTIKINIDPERNMVKIWNNGKGIPIAIHKEEKIYIPTMIFGHLLTSSNYDDNEKKVTGGRNGYGAKLCNIFSKKFELETACNEYKKKFKQVWTNNMRSTTEPVITDFSGTDYTCVTFYPDLDRFKISILDNDMISLLKRRAYDIAGTTKGVTVYLNDKKIPINNFQSYVQLYLKSGKKLDEAEQQESVKVVNEIVNDRWEVCIAASDDGYQHSSFVNSIATTKGGTHVAYVTDAIVNHVSTALNKKIKKSIDVKPHNIKSCLWVFINCSIENPTFDSQTKEFMTLKQKSFGSTCEISENTLKKVYTLLNDKLMSWVQSKELADLDKMSSKSKRTRLHGIAKLDDASDAGGKNSSLCTLILTEGDSAKTLAVAGLSTVGRERFGVFPLRGKLLNVREASAKQLLNNEEIVNLVKILGLSYTKKYDNSEDFKSLRYGRIMIMADQDQDGSHIKGLIINFIHHKWPNLIKSPFIDEFITPIIKVFKGTQELSFFSIPEFEEWKNVTDNYKSWKVKYYKGLGTSTSKEAKDYFSNMEKHRILFNYSGSYCDDSIVLAFSKDKINDRKDWLTKGMEERKRRRELGLPEIYLYQKGTKRITYTEFVNKELILFSNSDNERSIPSLVDGLKPGQRKVLFTCLKRNDKKEVKVAQLAGSVAEMSSYHHGEASLMATIINLAQDFVGSNNINILLPNGQFGTRLNGGKDSASPRYIFTMLNPLVRFIFPQHDDYVLNYLIDDNQVIEPEWYCPIIPMLLVNGAEGIGTGYSTKIPNYNPLEIVENIRRMLRKEEAIEMNPWFKFFKGKIMKTEDKKYVSLGEVSVVNSKSIQITELPVRCWTQGYKENVLETMITNNEISDYKEFHTDLDVHFMITMDENQLSSYEDCGLINKFKLDSSLSISNMYLFDQFGVIKKYDSALEILKEFYEVRLKIYFKRKEYLLGMLQAESDVLQNQARFILEKIEGTIVVENKPKVELIKMLFERKYQSDPVKAWKKKAASLNSIVEQNEEELEEKTDENKDYNYILTLTMWNLTKERKEELLRNRDNKLKELNNLKAKTPEQLWIDDLDKFVEEYNKLEASEKKSGAKGGAKGGDGSSKKPIKKINQPLPILRVGEYRLASSGGTKAKVSKAKNKDLSMIDDDDVDNPKESVKPKKVRSIKKSPSSSASSKSTKSSTSTKKLAPKKLDSPKKTVKKSPVKKSKGQGTMDKFFTKNESDNESDSSIKIVKNRSKRVNMDSESDIDESNIITEPSVRIARATASKKRIIIESDDNAESDDFQI